MVSGAILRALGRYSISVLVCLTALASGLPRQHLAAWRYTSLPPVELPFSSQTLLFELTKLRTHHLSWFKACAHFSHPWRTVIPSLSPLSPPGKSYLYHPRVEVTANSYRQRKAGSDWYWVPNAFILMSESNQCRICVERGQHRCHGTGHQRYIRNHPHRRGIVINLNRDL